METSGYAVTQAPRRPKSKIGIVAVGIVAVGIAAKPQDSSEVQSVAGFVPDEEKPRNEKDVRCVLFRDRVDACLWARRRANSDADGKGLVESWHEQGQPGPRIRLRYNRSLASCRTRRNQEMKKMFAVCFFVIASMLAYGQGVEQTLTQMEKDWSKVGMSKANLAPGFV